MSLDAPDPTEEIEITPAMIEAGLQEYALFDSRDRGEWVVTAVYRAMALAIPKSMEGKKTRRHRPGKPRQATSQRA
jgi:hypothetical protein